MRLGDLHPGRFFLDVWRAIDEEALALKASESGSKSGDALLVAYVFAVAAVCLVLQEYWGGRDSFFALLYLFKDPAGASSLYDRVVEGGYLELWVLGYWASWRVLGFLALPALAAALHPGLRRAPLGLGLRGVRSHIGLFALLLVPALLAVLAVSFREDFTAYYPFYVNAHRTLFDFAVWEAFYVAQFFALEFFFRGFMLQPLRRAMGSSAIFAMTLPYVMIHIGKPMIECIAAIFAGIVLGTLAMRTRSMWIGFLLHASVALSMDILAIWRVHW